VIQDWYSTGFHAGMSVLVAARFSVKQNLPKRVSKQKQVTKIKRNKKKRLPKIRNVSLPEARLQEEMRPIVLVLKMPLILVERVILAWCATGFHAAISVLVAERF
jgi:hypothetical protein